jgi:hypothetical protein
VLALLASGVAGCASAEQSRSGPRAQELALSATAVYGRHAAVRGKVDVRIANRGAEVVEVESYQVRHPQFERVPPAQRRSRLPADGEPRIVPVPFGAPRCDARDDGGAVVVMGVRSSGGAREVTVPLADGEPGLARAHRLACGAAAVADAAALELGPTWTPGTDGLRTALRLNRRGTGPVVVTELRGNVLFTVRPAATDPVVALPAGQRAAQVDVVVSAARCEAHALTESKTSFTFPLFAAVGAGEPVQILLTVTGTGRQALQDLLDRTCGPLLDPSG